MTQPPQEASANLNAALMNFKLNDYFVKSNATLPLGKKLQLNNICQDICPTIFFLEVGLGHFPLHTPPPPPPTPKINTK